MSHEEMQISEGQLRAMTAELVDMHEDTFPALRNSLADISESIREQTAAIGRGMASRRGFIAGGGALAGGLLLSACGSKSNSAGSTTGGATAPSNDGGPDAASLRTNASLEALAVFAYGAALQAAPKGKFGAVPAAVGEFATVAMKQHKDHQDAFNAALTGAGGKAYTMPDPALAATVTSLFGKVNSIPGLAGLALTLENTAAATYIQQMGTLTSKSAIGAVATIAPVERQHSAILSFVLGDYPVPDAFVMLTATKTSLGARPSTDAK